MRAPTVGLSPGFGHYPMDFALGADGSAGRNGCSDRQSEPPRAETRACIVVAGDEAWATWGDILSADQFWRFDSRHDLLCV